MTDLYPTRIDWPAVCADIRAAGVGYRAQARALGLEWDTYRSTLRGHEPRHSTGAAILELHGRYCGEAATRRRIEEARPIELTARTSGNSGGVPPALSAYGRG